MNPLIRAIAIAALNVLIAVPALAAPTEARRSAIPEAGLAERLSVSRDRVAIKRDMVRLGDLFSNTGAKADRDIEPAPAPGAQAVFDVHRLAAIARDHGLTWQARSWSERVVIERASRIIGVDPILAALRAAVEREMAGQGGFDIETSNRDLSFILPAESMATIKIENLRLHGNDAQFVATVATEGAAPTQRLTVTGRLHRVIDVPTLNRRVAAGEIIGANDIHWVTQRADRVNRNVLTDAESIIGMAPMRTLMAGKAVLDGEVQPPRIVTKGNLVVMLFETSNMVLTSKGRALEHGAKGDVIKVMNVQSKTIVEGEVTASGTISVSSAALAPSWAANTVGAHQPARR